jgi:hypothetical protein
VAQGEDPEFKPQHSKKKKKKKENSQKIGEIASIISPFGVLWLLKQIET